MLDQLRYSGVIEVVHVARSGYAIRFPLIEFIQRFSCFGSVVTKKSKRSLVNAAADVRRIIDAQDPQRIRERIVAACSEVELERVVDYQIGHTKVFLRAEAFTRMNYLKFQKIRASIVIIQRFFRRCFFTHRFDLAAKKIQKRVRGYQARARVLPAIIERRKAAHVIHSSYHFQRQLFRVRQRLEMRYAVERAEFDAPPSSRTAVLERCNRVFVWYLVPLLFFAGAPHLVRTTLSGRPYLMTTLVVALMGSFVGSFVVIDEQRKGRVSEFERIHVVRRESRERFFPKALRTPSTRVRTAIPRKFSGLSVGSSPRKKSKSSSISSMLEGGKRISFDV